MDRRLKKGEVYQTTDGRFFADGVAAERHQNALETRQKAHLENWWAEPHPDVPGSYWILGNVYGHPNPHLPDGMEVHTSILMSLDFSERTAETMYTDYTLGSALNSGEPSKIPTKETDDGQA